MGTVTAAAAAASKSSSGSYTFLFIILIVFVGFYFLLIRPQRRRQQAVAQQQKTVTPGARVRTTAGMYATVSAVDGDDVVLEVAPGVEVRYMKRAVMEVITPGEAEDSETVDEAGYAEDDPPEDSETSDAHDEASSADQGLAESDKNNVF